MKTKLTTILILISFAAAYGQKLKPADPSNELIKSIQYVNPEQSKINYIIIYKRQFWSSFVSLSTTPTHPDTTYFETLIEGFETTEDLEKWLNDCCLNYTLSEGYTDGNYHEDKKTKLLPRDILGVYDLRSSKKVALNFYTDYNVQPKKVVIEEQKWVEQEFKVIKP